MSEGGINALNLPVRPVTRLAVAAPPTVSSNGGGQRARPSRPAGYAGRWADKGALCVPSILAAITSLAILGVASLAKEAVTSRCLSLLQLRVRGDGTRVSITDPLLLTVEVVNTSDDSVWLYGNLTYEVWLWVYDASGRQVPTAVIFEHLPPPPEASDYLALHPWHSLVLHDRYPLDQLGLPPGKYAAQIDVQLLGALPALKIPACSGRLPTPERVNFEVVK